MPEFDNELERIAAVLFRTADRSSLYQWLWQRRERFANHLRSIRPNWGALAIEFGAMGLKDSKGKAPTGERTRKTWYQVRQDTAGPIRSPASKPSGRPDAELPVAPCRIDPPPLLSLITDCEDPTDNVEFKPARLRGRRPKPNGEAT